MKNLFYVILYQPLFNALIFFYNLTGGSLGMAVILLTLSTRVLFFPLFQKSLRSQMALAGIQPEIDRIKKQYPQKEEQMKKIMDFYKEKKVNPMGGCLPLLIQLPILIALYQVFLGGFDAQHLNLLYAFIHRPESVGSVFLGIVNLSQKNFFIAVLAGILQFLQTKMMTPQTASAGTLNTDLAGMISRQMLYLGPLLTVFILLSLPSVVGLYWIITSLTSIGQQYLVKRTAK